MEALSRSYFLFQFFESTVSLQFLSSMFFFSNFAVEKSEISAEKLHKFLPFFFVRFHRQLLFLVRLIESVPQPADQLFRVHNVKSVIRRLGTTSVCGGTTSLGVNAGLESPNHRMPNPRWLGRKTKTEKNCRFEENEQELKINRNNLISDRS